MMHGREKSDSAIVAVKPTNKAVPTAAEPVMGRADSDTALFIVAHLKFLCGVIVLGRTLRFRAVEQPHGLGSR